MDTNLRASLIAAGTAFLLSALVGLASRVVFLALVGRAFLWGFVFGALAYGALYLMRSFRLVGSGETASIDDPRSPEGLGHAVDIVLPEDGPSVLEVFSQAEESAPDSAVGIHPLEAASGEPRPEASAEPPGRARASARSPLPAAGPESLSRRAAPVELADEPAEIEDLGSLLDDDEASDVAAVPPPTFAPVGRVAESFDDLDVLPDLEGFSDSFAAPEFRESGPGRAESTPQGASRSSQLPGLGPGATGFSGGREGFDPASLAQAVRTILKRDQKG